MSTDERTLQDVVNAMRRVRVLDGDQQPFVGELRLKYYDGYIQKSVQVKELPKA